MTSVPTRVGSVHWDERPHEWRSVYDPRGYPQLVTDILTPPPPDSPHWVHGHRMIILGKHPYDPTSTEVAPMLMVAVKNSSGGAVGAAYVREVDHGRVTGWITANPRPLPDPPDIAFSSQGWNSFPPDAVVSGDQLRELVTEYLATGRRPESVGWRESEMVQ